MWEVGGGMCDWDVGCGGGGNDFIVSGVLSLHVRSRIQRALAFELL